MNDLMTQCSRKLIKRSQEEEKERINEIRNCNHLFVKVRERVNSYDSNADSSIIECVHCGVTNKFVDLEHTLTKYNKSLDYYVLTRYHSNDIIYNECTIETDMMNEIIRDNKPIRLMSNEIIRSLHPIVLYDIAKFLYPEASDEELFSVMKELNELETSEEKNKLCSIFDAKELIERYFSDDKVLKKEL